MNAQTSGAHLFVASLGKSMPSHKCLEKRCREIIESKLGDTLTVVVQAKFSLYNFCKGGRLLVHDWDLQYFCINLGIDCLARNFL